MEVPSRGFHVCGREKWKSPNTMQKLLAEKEKSTFALKIDPYSVSWKLKTKDKLILVVVGHAAREISRFVSFFYGLQWMHGRCCFVTGIQGISKTQGWFFTIAEEKSEYPHHLKELIKDYYEPITDLHNQIMEKTFQTIWSFIWKKSRKNIKWAKSLLLTMSLMNCNIVYSIQYMKVYERYVNKKGKKCKKSSLCFSSQLINSGSHFRIFTETNIFHVLKFSGNIKFRMLLFSDQILSEIFHVFCF